MLGSWDEHLWTTLKTKGGVAFLVVMFTGGEGMKGPPAHGHLSTSPSSCEDTHVWEVMTVAPFPNVC